MKRKRKFIRKAVLQNPKTLAVLLLAFFVCIGLAAAGSRLAAKSEKQVEAEENLQPGDWAVTEIEVESEELSPEEIQQMETEAEGEAPSGEEAQQPEQETSGSNSQNNGGTSDNSGSSGNTAVTKSFPYYIKVNRAANCVTVYGKDASGAYTVPVKAMICSVGKNTGVFRTSAKYSWRALYGNQYGQYATRITGHILFHSVPYQQAKKDTLKTDYYNNLGIADSMGCIRLTVADAKWIYDNCSLGTTVEIYDDAASPGPLGKPSAVKIDGNSPYAGWDPTDPDPANPWVIQNPVIAGVKDIVVEWGTSADVSSHVSATDFTGTAIPVGVAENVNTRECGAYTVTYTATDALGNSTVLTATVTVADTTPPELFVQPTELIVQDGDREIAEKIKAALRATDRGQDLDAAAIVVDIALLEKAMEEKSYGEVICEAYALDACGNQSEVLTITVHYLENVETETEETEKPEEP